MGFISCTVPNFRTFYHVGFGLVLQPVTIILNLPSSHPRPSPPACFSIGLLAHPSPFGGDAQQTITTSIGIAIAGCLYGAIIIQATFPTLAPVPLW